MGTIATAWEIYRKLVVNKDASEVQLRETEIAFYSGAWALLHSPNLHILKVRQKIEKEIRDFKAEAVKYLEEQERKNCGGRAT